VFFVIELMLTLKFNYRLLLLRSYTLFYPQVNIQSYYIRDYLVVLLVGVTYMPHITRLHTHQSMTSMYTTVYSAISKSPCVAVCVYTNVWGPGGPRPPPFEHIRRTNHAQISNIHTILSYQNNKLRYY